MKNNSLSFPQLPLWFFHTEKRQKELFTAQPDSNTITMYTCGPTVYHFAHIGNFRTYVFEDLLRRTLKFFGYQVIQAMNITDVDDKTIRGALQENISLQAYVQPYKNAFFADLSSLNIEPLEYYPCATDYIPHMIDFIQKLIDKGIAYQSKDGSVYFSIDHCPQYGRLSHLPLADLKVGATNEAIANDEYDKENIGDFVLWKAYDEKRDGSIYWQSPFGPGRPGWHLECSTMAMQLLGSTIDLHIGAVDNIFPHHENEIAQSECLSGKQFARYWLHSEHLIVDGKKMSKSLGNFYTLRDLLHKGYSGLEVRYMLLHTHYRTQLNFTFEGMEAARSSLARLNAFILRMQEIENSAVNITSQPIHNLIEKTINTFTQSLADDLNISVALAAIFDLVRDINSLADLGQLSSEMASTLLFVFRQFNTILGCLDFEQASQIPEHLQILLQKRIQARQDKNWKLADELRDEIHAAGYVIEDTPSGARLKANRPSATT